VETSSARKDTSAMDPYPRTTIRRTIGLIRTRTRPRTQRLTSKMRVALAGDQ
jgi:hypothetical protein